MKNRWRHNAVQIISGMLVLLFTYTAVSKLADINTFRSLMGIQPFSHIVTAILTWAIPGSELVTSVLLLFRSSRLTGLYAALCILFSFTFYTVLILSGYYKRQPCSCGGIISNMSWGQHFLFNTFFILINIAGIVLQYGIKNYHPHNILRKQE